MVDKPSKSPFWRHAVPPDVAVLGHVDRPGRGRLDAPLQDEFKRSTRGTGDHHGVTRIVQIVGRHVSSKKYTTSRCHKVQNYV